MKNSIFSAILCTFFIFTTAILFPFTPAHSTQEVLSKQVLRFHVLADTNSQTDQHIKLLVRDAILSYTAPFLEEAETVQEVKQLLFPLLPELTTLANQVLTLSDAPYTASVHIENAFFPVKQYGSLLLPPGSYEALRVVLGEGAGKNWWCLMFPSLCFLDGTTAVLPEKEKNTLKKLLPESDYNQLFSEDTVTFQFSSRLYELILPFLRKFGIIPKSDAFR